MRAAERGLAPSESLRVSSASIAIAFAAAYGNALVYGFVYGLGDQQIELAWVNWIRNPALYPGDPLTEMFTRFPTEFWPAVAHLARWFPVKSIVFASFLLTKALFFLALVALVSREVGDLRWTAAIAAIFALSPFLNQAMPFGASVVLDSIQAHSALGVALLLGAGFFLLEGRWLLAGAVLGFTTYVSAILVAHHACAWLAFAALDWRRRKREVAMGSSLALAIAVPWLLASRESFVWDFPTGYVQALLMFWPPHLTIRSHSAYDLVRGGGLVLAVLTMTAIGRGARAEVSARFEVLAASFVLPVALGTVCGELHLTPHIARWQFLRADSFLVPYAFLIVQITGAKLLLSPSVGRPWTTRLVGIAAVISPLSSGGPTLGFLFVSFAFWLDPRGTFERACAYLARTSAVRAPPGRARWATAMLGVAIVFGLVTRAPPSRLWNPAVMPKAGERDWRDVQRWAKENTPLEAGFLVPTDSGGFRVFSERSSWGEWKDGQAVFHYPPFADTYRERMTALGLAWGPRWNDFKTIRRNYVGLPWDRLTAIARENRLDYVVQYRSVRYSLAPVYANGSYAVYHVPRAEH